MSGHEARVGSLTRGFGGLKGRRALLAYLESRAAVELIEDRHPRAIGRWLDRCAHGMAWESALRLESGWDVRGLDTALRELVLSRFPADPLASLDTPRILLE